ncbi:hypothetical protein [Burkholderia alba]|uniref:hypothetical protein n=1 Tax=Burkholderia alba TaxID=2683677 RepID=UPI002B0550F4|nr:hypothetical protein [Burkholderia alba]
MTEIQSWTGRPSQWTNGPLFLGCFLLAATCVFVSREADKFHVVALSLARCSAGKRAARSNARAAKTNW